MVYIFYRDKCGEEEEEEEADEWVYYSPLSPSS